MEMFNNLKEKIFGNKNLKKMIFSHKTLEDSKLPENLKNLFKSLQLLLDIVIVDTSFAKYFAEEIISELEKLSKEEEKMKLMKNIRKEFKHYFQIYHKDYNRNPFLICYYNMKNLLIFIYMLLYNLSECKEFYLIIFNKSHHLWEEIFSICSEINQGEIEIIIYNILNDKLIIQSIKQLSLIPQFKEFLLLYKNRKIPKKSMQKFDAKEEKMKLFLKKFKSIKKIDDSWFQSDLFQGDSLQIIKTSFSNSFIRILMSDNIIKIKSSESDFKVNFLENLISNYAQIYYTKYGNQINQLYINDMEIEEILLNFCPIYGGYFYIKYMNQLIDFMVKNDCIKEHKIFGEKFSEFINNIKDNLPKILIFICKTLQNEIQRNCSIAIDDYSPIYIYLFQLFFFADKYKDTYYPSFPQSKNKEFINLLLLYILINKPFPEDSNSEMKELNEVIKECHILLKNNIGEMINDFESNEFDNLLKEEKENNKICCPDDFLFIYDYNSILIFLPKEFK